MKLTGKLRMIEWLFVALALYGIALALREFDHNGLMPAALIPVQTATWKLANLTIAAYVGFFIDRAAFAPLGNLDPTSPPAWAIRRAIIMAAAMLAVALGL